MEIDESGLDCNNKNSRNQYKSVSNNVIKEDEKSLLFITHLIFLSTYSKKIILDKISIKETCKIIILNPIIKLTTSVKKNKKKKI